MLLLMPNRLEAAAQARQEIDPRPRSLQDEREDPDLGRDPAQLGQGREVPRFVVVRRPGEEQVRAQGQVEGVVIERQTGQRGRQVALG